MLIWKHGTNTDPDRSKFCQIKVLINHYVPFTFESFPNLISAFNPTMIINKICQIRVCRSEIYFITFVVIWYYLIEAKKEKDDFLFFSLSLPDSFHSIRLYRKVCVEREFTSGLCQSNREKRNITICIVFTYSDIAHKYQTNNSTFVLYDLSKCAHIE